MFFSFTLNYDAENRLVSVTGASTANFYYDADGKQVKTVVDGVTTYYIGNHYEVKNLVVTKYYFAGATRLAVRTGGTLSFLLGDHIGSSSVTTDANGAKTASALYKAFGETRYSLGNLGTDYKFTGQREEASLGIYFFNARWMDPSLGRFTSPDSIVPTSTQGTQAWDRYAFVNNNPVRYNDPTGHTAEAEDGSISPCSNSAYGPESIECLNYRLDRLEEEEGEASGIYQDQDKFCIKDRCLNKEEIAAFFVGPFFDGPNFLRYVELTMDAIDKTKELYGTNADNGEANAFQHAYWSALLTDEFGEDFAKELTDAHEQNSGRTNGHFMDYHNNEVGRKIATGEYSDLATAVQNAVSAGRTIMLDANGNVVYTGTTDPD